MISMVAKVEQYLAGWSMAGAGGGGFMYFLLKDPSHRSLVQTVVSEEGPETLQFVDFKIDIDGLVVSHV